MGSAARGRLVPLNRKIDFFGARLPVTSILGGPVMASGVLRWIGALVGGHRRPGRDGGRGADTGVLNATHGSLAASDTRIVLRREVSRDEFGYFAYDRHWRILRSPRLSEPPPRRQVWSAGADTSVTYLEDPYLGLHYVVVQGKSAPQVSHAIRASVPCWTLEEALEFSAVSTDRDTKIHGIHLVTASAPVKQTENVVEYLETLSGDNDPQVRRAVLVGMAYLGGWPAVHRIAESMRDHDPDEGVRIDAGYLLEGISIPPESLT
ncbi:hypothetical protein [Bailinhaonella thermotolerans]|uniref:HEAT repeat domain-containing protein n=1 Tax=Bailinhaonella thermotolerans TaxID=1070861 RepID=A0A3A4AYK3_9ACTN|nr:hypothetical protein [Bailinhaonella thermotolerans]RJL35752.1 hypothetical protein D5H75_02920 [Bailinhaonella thermotolerans]